MLHRSVHICVNANGLSLFDAYESMETSMPAFALVIYNVNHLFWSFCFRRFIYIVKRRSTGHGCSTDVLFRFITSFGHIKVPLLPCGKTLSLKINRNCLFLLATYLCNRCFPVLPVPLWRPGRDIKDTINSEIEMKNRLIFSFQSIHFSDLSLPLEYKIKKKYWVLLWFE